MSTQVAERRQEIANVQGLLDKMKSQMAMALPKHITPERMVRVALTAVQNTPKLLECDRNSLLMAVLRSAQLGLEPDGILGQAYLIPYGKQVQLIPGYKGLIDLARRTGEVTNIIAKEVYANDVFDVDFSKEIPFVHKPKLEGERGEIKFFWAMARFKDGGFHWDYMTKKEVEAIRDKGTGKNNAVWKEYFIEMGKKTAIRRIAKYLPMSVQKATITEDLIDAGKKFNTDDFGEIILQNDEPQDITPAITGNEGVKEALKKKQTQKQDAPTQVFVETPKQEIIDTTPIVELIMPDGQVWQYPTPDITTDFLIEYLQGMVSPDEKEFVRNNIEALPIIITFMRNNGKTEAAEIIEKLIHKK